MARNRSYTNVDLTGMHSGGRTFGFVGGKRIYADYGIPGEKVNIAGVQKQCDFLKGIVSDVIHPDANRVEPLCKHFGICGGCSWQHLSYEGQLEWKRQLVINALNKYEIQSPEIPAVIASPQQQFYRHRLEYAFSNRRWYYEGEGRIDDPQKRLALGFHPTDNPAKVVDIEECYLQQEPGRKIYECVKEFTLQNGFSYYDPREKTGLMRSIAIRTTTTGEVMVIIIFGEDKPELRNLLIENLLKEVPVITSVYYGVSSSIEDTYNDIELLCCDGTKPTISEKVNSLTFSMSPRSFYQPNPEQAGKIFETISNLAGLQGDEMVVDLYSGIGTVALTLAAKCRKVIGIEGSPEASHDAVQNARLNGITNEEFINGDCLETFNESFLENYGNPDVVLLDPPRSGTLIEIKKTILRAQPRKIIYLSCNPLSLAFDLKMLTQGYSITHIQPFDQFPHTHHVETLVVLENA
ncbi:MAG TPA: 23S rRNA (uracil(1939)-C(5))-methyltransferase RlmD [Bacteroidales bacterium]|nr:23S rRNA (uracil(1939)-C(5))-methyltransferase RlmD [Bacteroidales bacterium]